MTTRLDRLVLLLDTGSTVAVRNAAANQLGQVQQQRPEELFHLVARVIPHLRSKNWDTRIAAANALEQIARQVPEWQPLPMVSGLSEDQLKAEVERKAAEDNDFMEGKLSFSPKGTFDPIQVISRGKPLLASAGKEFDLDLTGMDAKERLELQKRQLKQTLGMEVVAGTQDLVTEADLLTKSSTAEKKGRDAEDLLDQMSVPTGTKRKAEDELEGLSARERIAMKRKLKAQKQLTPLAKVKVTDLAAPTSAYVSPHPSKMDDKVVVQAKEEEVIGLYQPESQTEWPFQTLCDHVLMLDLFDQRWEIRHGAALGLRAILSAHGNGAGKVVGRSRQENDVRKDTWLEDACARLVSVLALDRFSDFVGDGACAPVRETAGQALGAAVRYASQDVAERVLKSGLVKILQLSDEEGGRWEIRYGALIGVKWWMAARNQAVGQILSENGQPTPVLQCIIDGLDDKDDDVRGVAASTLVPVANDLVSLLTAETTYDLVMRALWDTLMELDDLSSATSSVMDLLSLLLAQDSIREMMKRAGDTSGELVPRFYPFLRHTTAGVRLSVLRCLSVLADVDTSRWVPVELYRLLLQNFLLEQRQDVLQATSQTWLKLIPRSPLAIDQITFKIMYALAMTPIGTALALTSMFLPSGNVSRKKASQPGNVDLPGIGTHDRAMALGDALATDAQTIIRGKIAASTALGQWIEELTTNSSPSLPAISECIMGYLGSGYAVQRWLTSIVLEEWGKIHNGEMVALADQVWNHLNDTINSSEGGRTGVLFMECLASLERLRGETLALMNRLVEAGISANILPIVPELPPQGKFSPDFSSNFVTQNLPSLLQTITSSDKRSQLNVMGTQLQSSCRRYHSTAESVDVQVLAGFAGAMTRLGKLPPKLGNLIRSFMNSIKVEKEEQVQDRSARALAKFIHMSNETNASVVEKVVKNLGVFMCSDKELCPKLDDKRQEGMITLDKLKKATIEQTAPTVSKKKAKEQFTAAMALAETIQDETQQSNTLHRGSKLALSYVAEAFGPQLFIQLPKFWEILSSVLACGVQGLDDEKTQGLIDNLFSISELAPSLDSESLEKVTSLLSNICTSLQSPYTVVRFVAAQSLASLAKSATAPTLRAVIEQVLPLFDDTTSIVHREAAAETVYAIVQSMDLMILPYLIYFVVPLLKRMSDQIEDIRFICTNVFATLVRLMPLENGAPDPAGLSQALLDQRREERKFIGQLIGTEEVQEYQLPPGVIKAELRHYQQQGVSWLSFLRRYGLHGILCDDMGLGKTLQTICILASDHWERRKRWESTQAPDSKPIPSLVVCPPTIVSHWYYEIINFTDELKPVMYAGNSTQRQKIRPSLKGADVIICSYDTVRNDLNFLLETSWNYIVLDEGHVIKNPKTKTTQAVKSLQAAHRLMLSGTPIQNNVLELWSLFDFLMPGFLGTEKQFNDRFGKPIVASREAKSSSKEQEAGALALETLHKQVLPFLLRRMKEDVLHDLPPKIIQDYACDLSDLQRSLYEDFSQKFATGESGDGTHVFQALQYLRKLVNHPSLVLTPDHPQYGAITTKLQSTGTNLHDVSLSPKLIALKELLTDCGIGVESEKEEEVQAVSPHRALIFCQLKTMLDIIENDLFKKLMPGVTYLRLDGGVEATKRHEVVKKFNDDPSIDCLLLTTHVGGLGLNLTGADTVIFVEHDWNPMKDLQAMDRAHRIGQKRVVNVYRLITKGTLEEKIMGLQKFKLNIANSVVNADNVGLKSMLNDSNQVLDLFQLGDTGGGEETEKVKPKSKMTAKEALANLEDLWGEEVYREEYDLQNFVKKLQ